MYIVETWQVREAVRHKWKMLIDSVRRGLERGRQKGPAAAARRDLRSCLISVYTTNKVWKVSGVPRKNRLPSTWNSANEGTRGSPPPVPG